MYLGICEWQGTWRDRARKMRDGWKDRKGKRARQGETVMADKMQGNKGERQKARQRGKMVL